MMNENLYDENGNFKSGSQIEEETEEVVIEENNLSLAETFEYYSTIKDCMCEAPYACSTMMQSLAHRTRDTYKSGYESRGDDLMMNEALEERLISLQICNNEITDD